ncbi:MAG: glycosyltransferase [Lachnospiraceae bacterium]|nr:glycosyltransferase [Lachnospiraceae bacterium]
MKKRILFIIWSYSYGGGAEALLTTIVNHLNPQKYEIGILEYYYAGIKKEPLNESIAYLGAVTSEADPERLKKYYYLLNDPDRMIAKYIPSDYDLYVSFNYQIPSFLLPKGKRCVAWIHSDIYDLKEKKAEKYLRLQNEAFKKAQKIVSISRLTTESIKELCPMHTDKLVEICNGVDTDTVKRKAGETTGIVLEHPNILFVGRLEERKNPVRLVNVLEILHKTGRHVHLYYLGQGELSKEIELFSSQKGMSEYIHFLGYHQNPFPVMAQCDVSCLLSGSEGFSMSLLESVSLGKPFVSSYIGGATTLADGGLCGKVIETDEQAAEAIVYWLERDKDEIKKGCEASIERFKLPNYIYQIETLFDEMLEMEEGICSQYEFDSRLELKDREYYYHFPVEYIQRNQKIILYGAGKVGTDYYNFLKESHYCYLAGWVDKEYQKLKETGKEVSSLDTINDMQYDMVLIALANKEIAGTIMADLQKRGVSKEKIIWCEAGYI